MGQTTVTNCVFHTTSTSFQLQEGCVVSNCVFYTTKRKDLAMWQRLLHGLARAFTVPAAVRKQIDANPLTPVEKAVLAADLDAAIGGAIDKSISNPAINVAAKLEIDHLLAAAGLLK